MKRSLWGLLVLALLSQGRGEGALPWSATVTLRRIEEHKEVEGHWTLSSEWTGYMGLALELRTDGSFRYWFKSDVRPPGEPKYPVTGKYSIVDGTLVLVASAEIYDTRWYLISHDGRIGLFPASSFETIVGRRESPRDRMLFQIGTEKAEKAWPIYNEPTQPATMGVEKAQSADADWPYSARAAGYAPGAVPSFESPEGVCRLLENRWPLGAIRTFCIPERRPAPGVQNLVLDSGEAWKGRLYPNEHTGFDSISWYATVSEGRVLEYSLGVSRGDDFWLVEIGSPETIKTPPRISPDPTEAHFVGSKERP